MKAYKPFFLKAIKKHYFNESETIMLAIEAHYVIISIDTKFAANSSNPMDKRLDFCAYFLALIKTLDEKKVSFENIRLICLEVVLDYVKPQNKIQNWAKRLPVFLIKLPFSKFLIQFFHKKLSKKGHEEGFLAHIITNKTETYGLGYGFDILECGICKLFKKHNF